MFFLDSSYLIGLILKNDDYNNKASELESIIEHESKMINSTVFTEVLNSVTSTNSKYDFDYLIESMLSYDIHFLNSSDYVEAVSLFKYYNQAINFSDCTILKTMMDNEITTIVSFDSDFDKIKGINRIFL